MATEMFAETDNSHIVFAAHNPKAEVLHMDYELRSTYKEVVVAYLKKISSTGTVKRHLNPQTE
jgi:hypothetical protein